MPGWLAPSEAMDVRLQVIPGASRAVRHNMFATIHTGSSETVGRVRLLDCDRAEPGDSAWAQIKFEQPQAVVKGDCFVVRSNHETLGGGRVVDPHAKRHRRNYAPLLERLAVMEAGSDRDVLIKGSRRRSRSTCGSLPGGPTWSRARSCRRSGRWRPSGWSWPWGSP